jgi:protein-L-isoaspartate(D-aspartate) O-methyltransferase
MVRDQLASRGIRDEPTLNAFRRVPRELFVPEQYQSTLAFSDISIPLGHDQYMMPPRLEGRLLQSLALDPADRVLEIGTGSGYLTACLARLGNQVVSVDIHAELSELAKARLAEHRIDNVEFVVKDAAAGWDSTDKFDVIVLTGSLPQLHQGFHQSLNIGGRLFVVVGNPPVMEALLITRVAEDQWAEESLFDTTIPMLENASRPDGFQF